MPSASNVQTSFLGGEWSKNAQGRMGDPRYRTALAVCRNHIPLPESSITRRPGFRLASPTRAGAAGKLLSIVRGAEEHYVAELTTGHLRFYQQGGTLLENSILTVTNVALTSGYVRVTSEAHGLSTGDTLRFDALNAEARFKFRKLLNRYFLITVIDADNFDLSDALTGVSLGDSFSAFGASEMSIAVITDLTTPYTDETWPSVRVVQSDDRVLLLQGQTEPQEITTLTSVDPALFIDGPYLDPFPGSLVTPSALNGVIDITLSFQAYDSGTAYSIGDYVTSSSISYRSLTDLNQNNTPASSPTNWTVVTPAEVVNDGAGFTAGDAGRHVRLFSEPAEWEVGTAYALGDKVSYAGTYWSALQATTGDEPGVSASDWVVDPNAARWTWGKITAASVEDTVDALITSGSAIGNMTTDGGLAAAFDGNTEQSRTQGARTAQGTNNGYVGKNLGAGSQISAARVYPSTPNKGFGSKTTDATVYATTIELYGRHTAPTSPSDGTLLGTASAAAGTTTAITLLSNDATTVWEYVWVRISCPSGSHSIVHTSEAQFFDTSGAPAGAQVELQIVGDPLLYTSAIRTWRLGLYNNTGPSWPTTGCYHQGRFWLAGAVKNRFDASKSNDELNFSPTAPDGTVADNNAITYTLNAAEKNEIIWMKPEANGIRMGTAGGEFLVHASNQNNIITPTSIQADPPTHYGCSNVEPIYTGLTTVFVHESPRHLQEGMRDAYSGEFVAPEMTDLAKHLTRGGIEELAYTQALLPIIWGRTGEGKLFGTTYNRTNLVSQNPPEYNGFHRHDLGHGRDVTAIASGPGVHDELDTLAIITRGDEGVHYVEFGCHTPEEDDTIYDAEFLDGHLIPSAGETYAEGIRFHGLRHLNNQTVTVFAAGLDCGDFVVDDGVVEVPYGSAAGLFTEKYVNQLSAQQNDYGHLAVEIDQGALVIPAVVGYTYTSQGQLLRPVASDATGAANGPGFGKTRRNHQFAALFHNAQGVKVGTDFSKLRPALFATPGGRRYSKTELFSGLYVDTIDDDNSEDGMLCWEISRPFPATVLALGGFLMTQDK